MAEIACPAEPVERSVLVLARDVLPVADAAAKIERRGRTVVLGQPEPEDLATYEPIAAVQPPSAPAYLAVDVDLGAASRNVAPEDALLHLAAGPVAADARRVSRCAAATRGDRAQLGLRRPAPAAATNVPAFWISESRPKLGWCWDRNPHTCPAPHRARASRAAQPTMSVPSMPAALWPSTGQ